MAESRSALVVATYAYDDVGLTRLKAPARDAEALSEVLADPAIGGFEVRTVVNQPSHVVNLEVARFFANRQPDELLLLHFSSRSAARGSRDRLRTGPPGRRRPGVRSGTAPRRRRGSARTRPRCSRGAPTPPSGHRRRG